MANINGRPFSDVLAEIQNGELLAELTQAVYAMVGKVMEVRKPGKMKIVLEFTPTAKGSISISADFDTKEPEHDRPSTTFFVANDGALRRDDPNQPKLPLHAVDLPDNKPIQVEA